MDRAIRGINCAARSAVSLPVMKGFAESLLVVGAIEQYFTVRAPSQFTVLRFLLRSRQRRRSRLPRLHHQNVPGWLDDRIHLRVGRRGAGSGAADTQTHGTTPLRG